MIVLATWLWQGLAIACATALLLSLARNVGAATRHAVWWMSFGALVLLPLLPVVQRAATAQSVEIAPRIAAPAAVPLPALPGELTIALAFAWGLTTLIALVRVMFSVRAVGRLKARSTPFESPRVARLSMWNALDKARRIPTLRISADVRAASALGLGRPVILLSPAVLALDDDSLDAVVMHEYAHLTRFDDWTQLAQAVVSALLALHPAAWFIARRIRLEREAACDDYVIARGAAVREYARSLIELADPARMQPWGSVVIPGATRSPSELRRRVLRLLDPARRRDVRLAWPVFATSAITVAAGLGAAAQAPALVVFVESYVPAPPVAALARAATFVSGQRLAEPAASIPQQQSAKPVVDSFPAPPDTPGVQAVPAVPPSSLPPVSTVPGPLEPVPASQRLASVDLRIAAIPIALAPPAGEVSKSPPSVAEPWITLARSVSSAGKATGGGVKTAGTSIGRFFGRTGKAIAGSR